MPPSAPPIDTKLSKLLRTLHGIEDSIISLLLFGMIALAAAQILMRNAFDSGIIWADPLLRIMVLWLGLLGALAATRENKHISIDLLTRFVSGTIRDITRSITSLFSAAVSALLAYHSLRFVIMEYESKSNAFSDVPAWIMELILPIAFALITVRFLVHLGLNVRSLIARANKK